MNFIKYLGLGDVAMHVQHALARIEIEQFRKCIVDSYDLMASMMGIPTIDNYIPPRNHIIDQSPVSYVRVIIGGLFFDVHDCGGWSRGSPVIVDMFYVRIRPFTYELHISSVNDRMHIYNIWAPHKKLYSSIEFQVSA